MQFFLVPICLWQHRRLVTYPICSFTMISVSQGIVHCLTTLTLLP
nr:MAG TPA: hypothetical protein [Bacteriophage sp.]